MKILIFKSGAIGDVLMTTPFLRALREKYPKANIVYCVGRYSAIALKNNPRINKLMTFDEVVVFKKSVFGLLHLRNGIKKERFDISFNLDRSGLSNLFLASCLIPVRIGFSRDLNGLGLTKSVKPIPGNHHIREYLRLLGPVKEKNTDMELLLQRKDEEYATKFLKKNNLVNPIGISILGAQNPGQNMPSRRWPLRHYLKLIELLQRKNVPIILFGSPAEKSHLNKIGASIPVSCADVHKNVCLMKRCKLFITHDSGAMHLASIADIPVISLFGPTNPDEKAPVKFTNLVFWAKENYAPQIEAKKPKAFYDPEFMASITPEKVAKKALEVYHAPRND
ncbi:glycosyltransferase family 9 protein [Candidatus Woesearchaeota archaeon]|nr:glycosyltransferase family 9 protein [Candidatus Woesearchaeota archaeon]